MNTELIREQTAYWNKNVRNFEAIYTHRKNPLGRWLDKKFRWDMQGRFDYTFRQAGPVAGRSVLDVGCGTGRYVLEFARRGAAFVAGVDIAQNMLDVCLYRTRAEKLLDVCRFYKTNLVSWNPGRTFDIGVGIGLFDYVDDAQTLLTALRQCVTDRAIMSFPRAGTWRARVRKARLRLGGCSVFFYTPQTIARMIADAGFARHQVTEIGQLYCVTAFVRG